MTSLALLVALASARDPDGGAPLGAGEAVSLQEALALGMPRLHEPFADCQCVGMTWSGAEGKALIHELPREAIASVRHDVLDGPDELRLVLTSGEELLLEQAPCRYVARGVIKYSGILGVPGLTVDAEGAEVVEACGPPVVDVEAMREAHEQAMAAEQERIDDRKRARMELISVKGDPQVVLGVRSSLHDAVMGAGQCFGKAPVPADTRVAVKVTTKGTGARYKASSIGVEPVDRCFAELGDKVMFPAGKAKVKIAYVRTAAEE